MEAALFTYRCFEKPEDIYPCSVGSFIIYGRRELLQETAKKKFEVIIPIGAKSPARIHKVGPLIVHPLIRTQSAWTEIDWAELSRRVEREMPVRPEDEGSCVFIGPSIESGMLPKGSDLPPDIVAQMKEQLRLALLSQAPQRKDDCLFLFIGSAFRHDCFERTGTVYMIEAASLAHASAVCEELVEDPWTTALHVEWCCPIYNCDVDPLVG